MKKKELIKILKSRGFYILRRGKHEIWGNGTAHVAVPNHTEINPMLAKRLIKEVNNG